MSRYRLAILTAVLALLLSGHAVSAGAPACQIQNAEPDPTCTPSAVFNVAAAQVCVSGYATSVRDVTERERRAVFAEYLIAFSQPSGAYEIDHLVPLALGGSNDIANLWPEAASPAPGFHQKDGLENYLHGQVCSRQIALSDAQAAIASDWVSACQAIGQPSANTITALPNLPAPSIPGSALVAPVAPPSSAACVSYTGAPCVTLCNDGKWSSSTGRGTCSGHGGDLH